MINYRVTIGYKAIISIDVKAEDEEAAKLKAIELFKKQKDKPYKRQDMYLQDDSFNACGIENVDETWNML